jgi:predicted dehydrogenase
VRAGAAAWKEEYGMKQLRIIQIGVGFWGWSWVQVALDSPHWELVGIVEKRGENRRQAAEHYGFGKDQVFDSLDKAAAALKPDAAMVIVGAEAHCDVVIEALELGLHCIVEKPMTLTIDEGRKMVNAAERVGCKLMVSQNYRFKRAPQTVKSFLSRNIIGDVESIFVNFQKAPKLTGFRTEIDEPLITDMSIHHFDQMRNLLDTDAAWVLAHSWNTSWSRFRGNAVATVVFGMQNDAVVTYAGNWVSQGWETPWDGDWHMHARGGELRWTKNEVAFRTTNLLQEVYTRDALERGGELTLELVHMPEEDRWACLGEFAQAIHEDREPATSGRDNLASLAMVIGACRSIEERRPVTMEEVLEG